MKKDTLKIPASVLACVESLDELQDWLTGQNPEVIAELREAHSQDLRGEFQPWEPRHSQCATTSK